MSLQEAERLAAAGEALAAVLGALSRLATGRGASSLPAGVPKATVAALQALLPALERLPEPLAIELADSGQLLDAVLNQVTPFATHCQASADMVTNPFFDNYWPWSYCRSRWPSSSLTAAGCRTQC